VGGSPATPGALHPQIQTLFFVDTVNTFMIVFPALSS